jgi:hypothetical protein
MAQFTTLKYAFDSTSLKWSRTIILTLKKADTTSNFNATSIIKPYKENIMDSFNIKKLEIFPCESADSLTVNIFNPNPSPLNGSIKVLNTYGTTTIINQPILANNSIDFRLLAIGYYLLQIDINGQLRTYKVLKN